ncbi:RNA polymerase sigma-70 factor [Filimonas effusa]|uniref:RNA polymerase sigma-70 factor n=1 Tax=Filimonas effusa TaxID=2508721 RepID=A0A4Q1D857_9BACT|nr:RNA polymerase sigma-70 factor [Filimonas effusa]RXK85482.1 RNA polymerase sigma-70 factor [Filimonas effusa]
MPQERLPYLINEIAESSDENAFNELFRMYYPALLSYAQAYLEDKQQAEDVCIEVMAKLWENRKILPTINNLSAYLYIATKHSAVSYMRTKNYDWYKRKVPLEDIGESLKYELHNQDLKLIDKETLNAVSNAINTLPPRCRLIFKLIKEDGLKYAEVARLLDVSAKTIENQMSIAIKKLTDLLKNTAKEYFIKSS